MVGGYSVIPFNNILSPNWWQPKHTGCMYNDLIVYLDMNDEPYILRMKWPNKWSVYILHW